MKLTETFAQSLIDMPKELIEKPTIPKYEKGHYRMGFELQSTDKKYRFSAFGRYNATFPENFSVGLIYYPQDEKGAYEILRFNGQHGEHKMFPHHSYFHIHKVNDSAIEQGLKEDSYIEVTDKYTTFEDALRLFARTIKLQPEDIARYFPGKDLQLNMFEEK